MRPDMAKVVTERPRVGHDSPSAKTGARLSHLEGQSYFWLQDDDSVLDDEDTGPQRIKTSRLGQCRLKARANIGGDCHKMFSDLLGPLRAYLRKQVGRPWDAVYSELSATLDKRSLTGIHIWDHVRSEVTQHCELGSDGKVYEKHVRYSRTRFEVDGLYVHPATRLLCYAPRRRFVRPEKPADVVALTDATELRRIKGIWYHVSYGFVDRYVPEAKGRYYTKPAHWITERVLQRKRQLSRADLRQHKLRNEPVVPIGRTGGS